MGMTETVSPGFNLNTAIDIARKGHGDQRDKAGAPYILHTMLVMDQLEGHLAKITGVLHDLVEDGHSTFEELETQGCPPEVIEALKLVTHPEGFQNTEEEYLRWIEAIRDSGNQIAIDVKWADLTHNSILSRIPDPTEKDRKRMAKYKKSKDILRPVVSKYLTDNEKTP